MHHSLLQVELTSVLGFLGSRDCPVKHQPSIWMGMPNFPLSLAPQRYSQNAELGGSYVDYSLPLY